MFSMALSSSGFKFPAHAGVLEKVHQAGPIVELAGTSGGALVAGLYACGWHPTAITDWCLSTDWMSFLSVSRRPVSSGGLIDLTKFVSHLMDMTDRQTFREVAERGIDLKITATDVFEHRQVVMSSDTTPDLPVAYAIRASVSIPIVFTPFRMGDQILVDGALSNHLPIDLLTRVGTEKVGVRVTNGQPAKEVDWGLWRVAKHMVWSLLDQCHWSHVARAAEDNGVLVIDIDTVPDDVLNPVMTRHARHALWKKGYESFR